MSDAREIAYLVYDTESVVDGALLSRTLYSGQDLSPDEALSRYREEKNPDAPDDVFVPVTFHVPVAIATAKVGPDFRLRGLACLDSPRFDPREMVDLFWRGVCAFTKARLVDFNGRGFDLPLLSLSAFRYGTSAPAYFADPDRFGFRYRFTSKHIDLLEWLTEYGAYRLAGGLNLLAKVLGKPGKMETSGDQVDALYRDGKIQEINDYCLHDVLDTYFVFLRTRVMTGELTLEAEQDLVAETKSWLEERTDEYPALVPYVEAFGEWNGTPFVV